MKLDKFFSGLSAILSDNAKINVAPRWIGEKAEVQCKPHEFSTGSAQTHRVFIDAVGRVDGKAVILGWSTSPHFELSLMQYGQNWPLKLQRHTRGDVADALQLSSGDNIGFAAVSDAEVGAGKLEFEIKIPNCTPYRTGPVAEKTALTNIERSLCPKFANETLSKLQQALMGSDAWFDIVNTLPEAEKAPPSCHGQIEGIMVSPEGNGIVYGWALHPQETIAWFEGGLGSIWPLAEAFRRPRRDVGQAHPDILYDTNSVGFIAHLPGLGTDHAVRLRVATEIGIVTIGECKEVKRLPADPRRAAEMLYSIETEEQIFARRAPLVDWPVLDLLIARRAAVIATFPATVRRFGRQPDAPEVSVIVPLFRRFDFIEHQLLEFARDPEFLAVAELIYVIDDPDIANDVLLDANQLWQLYRVPFKLVSGSSNRGFSGANNLGASQARGARLLFLNSDVIPIAPGWLEALRAGFDADKRVGIVGARLLFPDGSLQHAGMEFRHYETLGIRINYHPNAGTAPAYDPPDLREVPAVTGACLMISRALFDEIGGWDTGYLIGDFEDSDLCLAACSRGFRVLYQPAACLTHLERQSFVGVGTDWFRNRMTICNAVRHQDKWQDLLPRTPAMPPQELT